MLNTDININQTNSATYTPLLCASYNKSTPLAVFEMLIAAGADVNHVADGGITVMSLYLATKMTKSDPKVVRCLLKA